MDKVNDNLWNKSKEFVQEVLKKTGVPGCSVGILYQGEIQAEGFGYSNIERKSPVRADTLFQIGSISKTFTAALAMKLVEEGKLDLHLPIRAYLPDFKVADETTSARVTPFHLLTHTAGWDGDLFLDTGDGADAIQKYIQRLAIREQLFPLGEYFSYNNSGFTVLGGILETITQRSLEELYISYIIEPLELKHMFFNAAEVITYDFSVGHNLSPDGIRVARPWGMKRAVLPAGGFVTNIEDLLHYAQCYLAKGKTRSGKQVLKPESIADMFTAKIQINKEDRTSRGYCWKRHDLEKGMIISHPGGTNGQVSELSLLPEHDFALAIFTNSDLGGVLIEEVQQFLLKTYLNVAYELPKEIKSTQKQLAAYRGTATRPGVNIYLEMLGRNLVGLIEATIGFPTEKDPPSPPLPPFRIGRCAKDRLIILDGYYKDTTIDIFRNQDGRINYLRDSRMYRFNPEARQQA